MQSYSVLRGAELDVSLLTPEGTICLVGDWGEGMWISPPGLPPDERLQRSSSGCDWRRGS